MIIVLRQDVSPREIKNLEDWLRARDTVTTVIRGEERSVIAVIGAIRFSGDELENHPAVLEVLRVSKPYKIASRESGLAARIRIGDCLVGGPKFIVMAGPCAVENRETLLESASKLSEMGVTVLRGGAFKPRTSPYSFQGLGEEGLKILAEARELTGDILQVGARNMQNFDLLKAVAEVDKPVILKRGMAATIDEWLMGAEYILGRNQKVILCERGIRTFETKTRNTLDLNAVPVLKELTHLPVIVDPSHGTGVRRYVLPMSLASMGAGADGLLVEVHPEPERALSDGAQSLTFPELERLLKALQSMAPVVGRELELTWRHPEVTTSASPPKVQVAYQGEPGAFSEMAALAFFGEIQPAGYPAFRDVFEKVASGEAAYGVIPIENSLAGSINQSYDLLLELDVAIVGELKLRVSHNLLSNRGVRKEDIRKLYGHPQALAQCDRFLRQHSDWTVFQTYDTAGSVKLIKDEGAVDTAAIASLRAASIYDVDILAEAIEDNPQNYTRFVIIAKEARVHEKCDKTSVVFTTPNEPGALFEVLKLAAECQVNLVKLESRPIQGRPWEYMFYMDFEGNIEAPTVGRLVRSLPDCTERLKVLGCYPAA
jgi:3-deoxy-D-arabino-heptulosonate 7-phosphate (DAHP) synthase/prephenate dehydratase